MWPDLLRELAHTRPDLVVVDTNTQDYLNIIIIEITVVYESDRNFMAAQEHKSQVYMPLVASIKASQPDRNMDVTVAVVIVGTRGIIPDLWFENLRPIQLSSRHATTLPKQSSIAAIQGLQWIWGLWATQAHGGDTN